MAHFRNVIVLALLVTSCSVTPTQPTPPTLPTVEVPQASAAQPTTAALPSPQPTLVPPRPSATRASAPSSKPTATAPIPTDAPDEWEVRTLLVGPGKPGRIYALLTNQWANPLTPERTRFLVSADGGASWTPFAAGRAPEPACVRNINLDYATADALYASTCQGLYRWTGNKWDRISPQQTGMVAVVYGQPREMWATAYGDRASPVIRSRDGGVTWQSASNGLVHFNGVANIGIDPRDAHTLYAIIWPKYGGSYLRRGTWAGNWSQMPSPMNNSQIEIGMTIDGATGALYVSAYDGNIPPNGHWQLWRTRNPTAEFSVLQWEKVHDFGQAGWVTVLASGESPQGLALYVRIAPTDGSPYVIRSVDGGATWSVLSIR